jgi:uncharacterized repeat protein (TIGR01451 family)
MEVFLRQGMGRLFIAFESPNTSVYPIGTPDGDGPAFQVLLDVDNDGGAAPQSDDLRLTVNKGGDVAEEEGAEDEWSAVGTPTGWTAKVYTATWGWQAEFEIDFSKLGNPEPSTAIGLGLAEVWTLEYPHEYVWPADGDTADPDSWGTLVSSSDWSSFYWKPGPWEDYAPSGLPDFDQRQVVTPSLSAPFAVANSFWWFDAKFEDQPVGPVGSTMPISDTYPLVSPYGPWDDHDPQNVVPLALDLADAFNTDPVTGTQIYEMYQGIQRHLRERGMWDEYVVTLVEQPTFEWIAQEAQRGEDVVLLLGFWQDEGELTRIGGHYVTVAGVDFLEGQAIAISDPAQDRAEQSEGQGRVLSGTLLAHTPPGHMPTVHNDAGNVSHDRYGFSGEGPWGGLGLVGYLMPSFISETVGLNPNPNWDGATGYTPGASIYTEIEYALAVSPYTWKASGRWVEDATVPLYGRRFEPFVDYAPSGVPDFDQRQDDWQDTEPDHDPWTFCGPVALANSLWWFDSKFEYRGTTPPTISGTHPLVSSYQTWPYEWDDHDPQNVDDSDAAEEELVDDLADYLNTDVGLHIGTYITDVVQGLASYLSDRGMRGGYVITPVQSPAFWWVAEEVERSSDVILLLDFWQNQLGGWTKMGGHYVTVAGVDKQGGLIAFSDPYFDRMEAVLPPGEFAGAHLWTGRVGSDGHPPLGPSGLVPTYNHAIDHSGVYTLHNDAANVSHDVYPVVAAPPALAGTWEPQGYASHWATVENFWGTNIVVVDFPIPESVPVHTVVDWAVAVSPRADVTVRKHVVPSTTIPGDWVTFTIGFSNTGPLPATDVVLGDAPPDQLANIEVLGTWVSNGEPIVPRSGVSFTWDLPTLAWGDWGLITMTAQVDPEFSWPDALTLTNWVTIATSAQEQAIGAPNAVSATLPVETADVAIDKQVSDDVVMVGDRITYTIVFTNNGPAWATSAVVTDLLHSWLTNTHAYGWTEFEGEPEQRDGYTYVWDVWDIPPEGRGELRISGDVSPPAGVLGLLPNQITIGTETTEWNLDNNVSHADVVVVEYGVGVRPMTSTSAGPPGSIVNHTLIVTNTGTYTDTYAILSSGGQQWTTTVPSSVGPIPADLTLPVNVEVEISPHAMVGESDQVTVTVISQSDGSERATAVLTTEVDWRVYLPFVMRTSP